jgi:hypothetical protein
VTPQIAGSANPVEVRTTERHDLALELRYSYRIDGITYLGTGRTRNLDGETVWFETDQEIHGNGDVELHILWPFRLQDVCQLELLIRGVIVRKNENGAVLHIRNCEFLTLGERSFSQYANWGITCNLAA